MNQVNIVGRITQNPDLKETSSGKKVLNFTVAVNEKVGEEDVATFVRCTAWGKTAETISHYFVKGKPILINGKIAVNNWKEDDGTKRSLTYVLVRGFEFLPVDKVGLEKSVVASRTEQDGFERTTFGDGWVETDSSDCDIPF